VCRPLGVQALNENVVVLYELWVERGHLWKIEETHYRLVPPAGFFG
jgi:hypothetical protein